jgi:hypothetical protein
MAFDRRNASINSSTIEGSGFAIAEKFTRNIRNFEVSAAQAMPIQTLAP